MQETELSELITDAIHLIAAEMKRVLGEEEYQRRLNDPEYKKKMYDEFNAKMAKKEKRRMWFKGWFKNNILVDFIKSVKNKSCPLIEWSDDK